jgi:hypothetical protein
MKTLSDLTAQDKIEILKLVLSQLKKNYRNGEHYHCICTRIDHYLEKKFNIDEFNNIRIAFGMDKYRPYGASICLGWFPYDESGTKRRIEIVQELITKFKNEISDQEN